ncbi:MAG: nicotinamide mononucleotide transporter [Clostridia bacterium]|nr:nicotinamide mononucleotide transporter [Clostridia bacterium]
MRFSNPFSELDRFEWILWISSIIIIAASFLIGGGGNYLTLIASLIGATALIFVAKGRVFGQVMTVVFAVFYAVISWHFRYYGEMITYLFMTSPMAIWAAVEWLKNPYEHGNGEVKVAHLTKGKIIVMSVSCAVVTFVFYFILRHLGTGSLFLSTVSIATSFLACALTLLRSPYYALGYSANDVVLILLWIIASASDITYLPMVICFIIFLANDLYGFYNWRRMRKAQS